MKFVYLCHGDFGYSGLKHLLSENKFPEYTFIHKRRDKFPEHKKYFEKMDELCKLFDFRIIQAETVSDFRNLFSEVDFGICVGYMEILKDEIFSSPRYGMVNLHCGRLPDYRGRAPICRAIMNGDENLFMTIHKISSSVDGGDILFEEPIEINFNDTATDLYNKCCDRTGLILDEIIELFEKNKDEINKLYKPQSIAKRKPYLRITDEERKIDFNKNAEDIYNLIRALSPPYPNAFFEFYDRRYFVRNAELEQSNKNGNIGKIIFSDADKIMIKCNNGIITLKNIFDEENNRINISDIFLQGANINGNN